MSVDDILGKSDSYHLGRISGQLKATTERLDVIIASLDKLEVRITATENSMNRVKGAAAALTAAATVVGAGLMELWYLLSPSSGHH